MYVAVLDDKRKEIKSLGRRSLAEYTFKVTATDNDEWDITFINVGTIYWSPLREKHRVATYLAHCKHADSKPFLILPLENSRRLSLGDTLAIGRGQLVLTLRNTKQIKKHSRLPAKV